MAEPEVSQQMIYFSTTYGEPVQVPASFARLGRLRSLILSHNRLTHVPMELSALPSLELFNAANNEIAAVDCILPSVRRLLLDDNRLTTIPHGVLRCRRLQVPLPPPLTAVLPSSRPSALPM